MKKSDPFCRHWNKIVRAKPVRQSLLLPFVVALGLQPYVVVAQTQNDIKRANDAANEVNRLREQKKREEERQRRLNKPKTQQKVAPELRNENISNEKCFDIDKLILIGITVISKREQQEIIDKYEKQCLKLGDINAILNDITTLYFDHGYITSRAYIEPKQDLNKGVLKIRVVEGILEKIILKDNRGGKSVAVGMIFPDVEGKIFQLRDIEQGLDQINRLGSNDASFTIEPGEEPGGSILVITNKAAAENTYTLSRSTTGSKTTGRVQYSGTVSMDNVFGLSDNLTISKTRTMPIKSKEFNKSVTAGYSVPYGKYTGSVNLSHSEFSSPIPLDSGKISSSNGTSTSAELGLNRMLYRNQTSTISANVGLNVGETKTYIDDDLQNVGSYELAKMHIGLDFDTTFLSGLLYGSYIQSRGVSFLGIAGDNAESGPTSPTAEFLKHEATLGYLRDFNLGDLGNFSFSTNWTGQYSSDVFYGGDQISIGGYYSVRGFPNVSIGGDKGFYVQNNLARDFTFKLPYFDTTATLSPYVGYDYGRIYQHFDGEAGVLSSYAYGLSLNSGPFSFDIMHAQPISYPDDLLERPKPEVQIVMSLTSHGLFDASEETEEKDKPFLLQNRGIGIDLLDSWFIGAEKSNMRYTMTKNFSAGASYVDADTAKFDSFVVGKSIRKAKLYAKYDGYSGPNDTSMARASLNADIKLFDVAISPFIGLSAGYYRYTEENLDSKNPLVVIRNRDNDFTDKIELRGPYVGGKVGLIYDGPGFALSFYHEMTRLSGSQYLNFDGVGQEVKMKDMTTTGVRLSLKF